MRDEFACWRVVYQPHVEDVDRNAAIEQFVDECGTFCSGTSEAVELCDKKCISRLQSLNQGIEARTFGRSSGEFFDDKFVKAGIFELDEQIAQLDLKNFRLTWLNL